MYGQISPFSNVCKSCTLQQDLGNILITDLKKIIWLGIEMKVLNKSGLIRCGLINTSLSQSCTSWEEGGEREVHKVSSSTVSPIMFRLDNKDFSLFFMLLYLFPKQIFYGSFSQRPKANYKHSWKSPRRAIFNKYLWQIGLFHLL